LAGKGLAAASSWANALSEGGASREPLSAWRYEAARTDPPGALDLASALAPSRDSRRFAVVHAISQWAATDAAAAVAWAKRAPDAVLRQRLLGAVAMAAADQNGSGAC